MFSTLMGSRRFAPIFWCQFFAAFNDNFLRNALVILVVFKLGTAGGEILATLSGAILIAPFLFFPDSVASSPIASTRRSSPAG